MSAQQQVVPAAQAVAPAQQPAQEEENLPLMARLVNHLMTPGSSHSSTMWTIFNGIILSLFVIWGMFVASMPTNIHVWVFGFFLVGLAITTNMFMNAIFEAKEDFVSRQEREKLEGKTDAQDGAKKEIDNEKKVEETAAEAADRKKTQ
jgi:hypothetical protein